MNLQIKIEIKQFQIKINIKYKDKKYYLFFYIFLKIRGMRFRLKNLYLCAIILFAIICALCTSIFAYKESYLEILNTIISLVGIILIPLLIYYFGSIIVRRENEQQKQIIIINYVIVELLVLNESLIRIKKSTSYKINEYKDNFGEIKTLNHENGNLSYLDNYPIPKIHLDIEKRELYVLSLYTFHAYKNIIILQNKITDVNNKIEDFNNSKLFRNILQHLESKGKTISADLFSPLRTALNLGTLKDISDNIINVQNLLIKGILEPMYYISKELDNSRIKQIYRDEIENIIIKSSKEL